MKQSTWVMLAAVSASLTIIACGDSNPTRPSASFAAPATTSPAADAVIRADQQPITLTIANAVRTDKDEVATYTFEVATDSAFSSIVFTQADVPEDPSGTTSVKVNTLDAGKTYYWHARTKIDGVDGTYSGLKTFVVQVPVIFERPAIVNPTAGASAYGPRPIFTVRNAGVSGPVGAVSYDFQVASDSGFGSIVADGRVTQQNGETSFSPAKDIPEGTLYWRARAVDTTNNILGPYTDTTQFQRLQGIDLSQVIYQKGPNISTWPQTSTILDAYTTGSELCIIHTKLGSWPATGFFDTPGPILEGNQWIFVNINGQWYGGATDWYRPGQGCKGVDRNIAHDSFDQNPIASWEPHSGEVFGVASTTPARLWPAMKTLDERTDVRLITWP